MKRSPCKDCGRVLPKDRYYGRCARCRRRHERRARRVQWVAAKDPSGRTVCSRCAAPYAPTGNNQKYCSIACRLDAGHHVAREPQKCAHCGATFQPIRRTGPAPKYCAPCNKIIRSHKAFPRPLRELRCIDCSETIPVPVDRKKRRRRCENCAEKKYSRSCQMCHRRFRRPMPQLFCSHECARLAQRNPAKICEVCGKSFWRRKRQRDARRCCSRACGWELQRYNAGLIARPRFTPIAFACCMACMETYVVHGNLYVHQPCRLKFVDGCARRTFSCVECGKVFSMWTASKDRAYCSDKCATKVNRRSGRIRKRWRLEHGTVEPIGLAEAIARSAQCRLCGSECKMNETGPLQPVLGHLIPPREGGDHRIGNVAAVHFFCRAVWPELRTVHPNIRAGCKRAIDQIRAGKSKLSKGRWLDCLDEPVDESVEPLVRRARRLIRRGQLWMADPSLAWQQERRVGPTPEIESVRQS